MLESVIVSVVIPCYNHGLYLEEAIESVESIKTNHSYEIIVVNDGSNDQHTLRVIKRISERGIIVINQENEGLAKARNNGIHIARGKYILALDSDNKVCSPYLTTAIDLLEAKNNLDVIYGDHKHFGERSDKWIN